MTIIAWRNGFMACDSCWATCGTQDVSANKIVRLASGALLGSAGDNDAREMYRLLDNVKDPRKLPSRKELALTRLDYEGLLAFPKGGVWMISTGRHDETGYPLDYDGASASDYDYGCWPATTMGGYAACGSGGELARGAMAGNPNLTAHQAVLIAIKHNVHCRAPVHVFKLSGREPKIARRAR